jgi:hypothetical protein
MKEINEINLQRMNNGAHFTFVSNILARAEADTAVQAQAKIKALANALKAAVAAEDDVLKVSQKSLLTDDITEADNERDVIYSKFKKAVKSFLDMPVTDMAKAAKELNQLIIDYKISPRDQLDKETGLMMNFIADLEKKYSEQVATLALNTFVTHMKDANEHVRELTLQRTDERTNITVGALKTARAATDDAYRALVKMVNAFALVYDGDEYDSFINYVNTEVVHYKREVLGQKASSTTTTEGGDTQGGSDTTGDSGSSTTGGGTTPSTGDDYGA